MQFRDLTDSALYADRVTATQAEEDFIRFEEDVLALAKRKRDAVVEKHGLWLVNPSSGSPDNAGSEIRLMVPDLERNGEMQVTKHALGQLLQAAGFDKGLIDQTMPRNLGFILRQAFRHGIEANKDGKMVLRTLTLPDGGHIARALVSPRFAAKGYENTDALEIMHRISEHLGAAWRHGHVSEHGERMNGRMLLPKDFGGLNVTSPRGDRMVFALDGFTGEVGGRGFGIRLSANFALCANGITFNVARFAWSRRHVTRAINVDTVRWLTASDYAPIQSDFSWEVMAEQVVSESNLRFIAEAVEKAASKPIDTGSRVFLRRVARIAGMQQHIDLLTQNYLWAMQQSDFSGKPTVFTASQIITGPNREGLSAEKLLEVEKISGDMLIDPSIQRRLTRPVTTAEKAWRDDENRSGGFSLN